MKKSKVLLAAALAFVILITVINVPTFSWFTRPQTQSGNTFVLGNGANQYNTYTGSGVTITNTKMSNDDGVTFNVATSSGGFSGTDLSPYTRDYYCTTIHNGSATEQNVSLYASTLTSNIVQFALGVNGPTRTYRDYTFLSAGTSSKATGDTMRVYFKRPTDNYVNGVNWHTGSYYVHWWINGVATTSANWVQLTDCSSSHDQYFVDIPKNAQYMYFYTNDSQSGSNRTEQVTIADWSQSQTDCQIFVAYNNTNGLEHSHIQLGNHYHVDGANIIEYYDTISIVNGSFYDASLSYPQILGNVTYSSSDSNIFTVDGNGKITTHGTGEATLTTTSTGQAYSDTMSKTTTVTVTATGNQEYHDVPIVKNMKIPAYDENDKSADPPFDIKVYWYVINNSNGTNLTYSIDSIYLGS